MKRLADFEGREESAGPLFEYRTTPDARCAAAAKSGARIDFDPERAYDEHLAESRMLPRARCLPEPDTIECTDHNGRVVGHLVDVTPRDGEDYPTLADCAAKFEDPARTLAATKRDLGMSRAAHAAERRSPGWEVEACAQVMEYAKRHRHFAVEDVRAVYGTPEGIDAKAWGPAMKRAARLGIVKADGFVLVNCSNRSPRTNWKSLVFEGSPKP